MKTQEKERLSRQTQKRYLLLRLKNGYRSLKGNCGRKYILCVFYVFAILFWLVNKDSIDLEGVQMVSPIFVALSKLALPVMLACGTAVILIFFGTPLGMNKATSELQRIGLTNSAGETPILTGKFKDEKQHNVTIFEFDGVGIPLTEWEDKRQRIEAAFNVHIVKLAEGKNKRSILLYTVSADAPLSNHIEWHDEFLINDSSTLVLGKSHMGNITVNLSKIPHILLGDSTGSGKSVLLKLLLMQAVKKDAVVIIADFKGGVDFPSVWHSRCKMCFDEDHLVEILTELVEELQRRKVLLRENECNNIDEYNKRTCKALRRYIFACDEVAEILDKTGLAKEQKDKISLIESKLSVIARQGRAFGIHLILATQRPDANILSGQIRNNIDCRVCGRADNVLSQIILDSTDAAELIPKDATGRFLLHDGTIFQAYLFDECNL